MLSDPSRCGIYRMYPSRFISVDAACLRTSSIIKLAEKLIFQLVGDQMQLAVFSTSQRSHWVHPDWVPCTVVIPKAGNTFREYLDLATWRAQLVRLRIGLELFEHDMRCFRQSQLIPAFGTQFVKWQQIQFGKYSGLARGIVKPPDPLPGITTFGVFFLDT